MNKLKSLTPFALATFVFFAYKWRLWSVAASSVAVSSANVSSGEVSSVNAPLLEESLGYLVAKCAPIMALIGFVGLEMVCEHNRDNDEKSKQSYRLVYVVHCTWRDVRGTLYVAHCTQHTVRGTMYVTHCT